MQVFITGVAGFIGSQLARSAIERGWSARGIDSMLGGNSHNVPSGTLWRQTGCRNRGAYQLLLPGTDVVFHAAAAPYEGLSVFSPELVYEHTLMSTVAVLRASIEAGAGRFVYCSSMSRYGAQRPPFTEDMPTAPVDPYGCAKVAAEAAVRCLCELHGLEWVIAVPHNVYGPHQRYTDPFRNVIAIMANRVLQGKPPVIYGDGSQTRSFSYIDDVTIPLMDMAVSPAAVSQVLNIGSDDPGITIRELAGKVQQVAGTAFEPEFFPGRPAEVHTAACSAAKARRVLGYQPQWSLDDGLAEFMSWLKEQGPAPFDYHLPVELTDDSTPKTWTEKLI